MRLSMFLNFRLLLRQISRFLPIDLLLASKQIRGMGRDFGLMAMCELIAKDQDQIKRDTQVRGDEIFVVEHAPFRVIGEDVIVLRESDDDTEEQCAV